MDWGNIPEIVAACMALLGVVILGFKGVMWVVAELTDHATRILAQEQFTMDTAKSLERTALLLARIDERTKDL